MLQMTNEMKEHGCGFSRCRSRVSASSFRQASLATVTSTMQKWSGSCKPNIQQ